MSGKNPRRPLGRSSVFLGALAAAALAACGSPPRSDAPPSRLAQTEPLRPPRAPGPARYLVPDSAAWVDRTPDGLDRVVANGCRIEARGAAIERVASGDPEVEGGFAMPPWTAPPAPPQAPSGSPAKALRYVFWKDKELYGAESFLAPLTKLATLRADINRAFDWIDGAGLLTADGVSLVRAPSAAASSLAEVIPFPVPATVSAVAVDARRALALTAFGHARLTLDGGSTYRDASTELAQAVRLEVRGDVITVALEGDRRRFVPSSGDITDSSPPSSGGPKRGARPPDLDASKWPLSAALDPLEAAVSSGVFLDDGSVVIAARGVAGRIDAASGRVTSAAELAQEVGDCAPVRLPSEILLLCESKERATVIELAGSPRVERTFDLAQAAELDRFSVSDGEAIGFVGPCDGSPPRAAGPDVVSSATPYNPSSQKSAVFCARKGRGDWIEHRLEPADAADVIAWIPRPTGAAVAVVARPGTFLDDAERVTDRGLLRVVRLARSEPPLAMPPYGSRSSELLARSLRASPSGEIEGWLPSTTYPSNTIAVFINSKGRPRVRPLPSQASAIAAAGPFGMAQTEDGRLFETTDWGERWVEVESPPGDPLARLSRCSPAGCRLGPVVRLGWTSPDGAGARAPSVPSVTEALKRELALRSQRERQYRRPFSSPPLVNLTCAVASPGAGARISDSYGFGFTPTPAPRAQVPTRIGASGTLLLPWNGSQVVTTGEAEVAWVPPLDIDAPVKRVTMSLARVSAEVKIRPYEVRVGHVIDLEGRVRAIAVGPKDTCLASLLDEAGVTRPAGGCAPDPAMGVDLGGRMVLLNPRFGSHTLFAVDAPGSKAGVKLGLVQRELGRTAVAQGAHGYTYGIGSRGGAPVAIALDGRGDAVLSPIDDARGTLGPEERLAPFPSLKLGSDPACAPKADQARIVLPFDSEIGLDRAAMPGVYAAGSSGLAVLRWSASQACLDAVEMSVRDERHEVDVGYYEPPGTTRKIVGVFAPKGSAPPTAPKAEPPKPGAPGARGSSKATAAPVPKPAGNAMLALILHGAELRQRLQCWGIAP